MRHWRIALLFLALCTLPLRAQVPAAQTPAAQAPAESASAKVWQGRNAEYEDFLRKTPFVKFSQVPVGVTRPKRGYFAPGGLAESAAWKMLPPGRPSGYWESYKSEIAAYELDKFFGMDMVPPAVEKEVKGEMGAAVLWIGPVRSWKEVASLPKPDKWNRQAVRMKMFDNLIGNIDRNAGNLLVDGDWNLYLIDHSRAFISDRKLPFEMTRIDAELWDRMLALDQASLKNVIGKWVDGGAIRSMLQRRDEMKKVIEGLVKTQGQQVFVK